MSETATVFQRIYKPEDRYAIKDWVWCTVSTKGQFADGFLLYVGDNWYAELCTVCLN